MVATRKSLPTNNDPSNHVDTPDASTMTEKQKRHLKKLQIDVLPTILTSTSSTSAAAAKKPDEKRVYHYRGAVYEMQGDEPEAWMELEPERYRKRKSEGVMKKDKEKEKEGEDKQSLAIVASRSPEIEKKRKRSSDEQPELEPEQETQPPPLKRRTRPVAGTSLQRSHPAPSPSQQQQQQQRNLPPTRTHTNPSLAYDYTLNGGHDPTSCAQHAQHAREAAWQGGLQVHPFSQAKMDMGRSYNTALLVVELARVNGELRRAMGEWESVVRCMELSGSGMVKGKGGKVGVGAGGVEGVGRVDTPVKSRPTNTTTLSSQTGAPPSTPLKPPTHIGNHPATLSSTKSTTMTDGRAEQYLFGGRFAGESLEALDRRREWEEGFLGGMMTKDGAPVA